MPGLLNSIISVVASTLAEDDSFSQLLRASEQEMCLLGIVGQNQSSLAVLGL